jgi:hypothetical protein
MRRILSVVASSVLLCSSVFADVKPPSGFDNKVYRASMALYGTLPKGSLHLEDGSLQQADVTHFLCTVTAFKKVKGGYELLGAGHCTGVANEDLPRDLVYSVSDNIGDPRHPVQLLKAVMTNSGLGGKDYAVYYFKTDAKIPVVELGDESDVQVGSPTVNVNFSLGEKMTKQLTRGSVASQVAKTPSAMAGMILIQQFNSHGASGSSIVSEKTHKIIGLTIAGYDGTTTPTIAETISSIKADIASVQIP